MRQKTLASWIRSTASRFAGFVVPNSMRERVRVQAICSLSSQTSSFAQYEAFWSAKEWHPRA